MDCNHLQIKMCWRGDQNKNLAAKVKAHICGCLIASSGGGPLFSTPCPERLGHFPLRTVPEALIGVHRFNPAQKDKDHGTKQQKVCAKIP